MSKLHILVGLPRSGKSTLSKQLGYPIVETDAIRKALRCYPFDPKREPEVWDIAHKMVDALFLAGHEDVILDSVSHTSASRQAWSMYDVVYHEVCTDVAVCVARAEALDQDYLVPVIERMAKEITWPSDTY